MQDAAFRVLLGFLIFFGLAIGASFWLPGSLDPGAALHPDISSLLQSSGRAHSSVILIAFGMAMIIVTVMSIFVWVGFYKPAGGASLRKWSIVFFAVYLLIFAALFLTYDTYFGTDNDAFWGGFPAPTAWMIYGCWLFPGILIAIYALKFDEWILTEEDKARFEGLMAEHSGQTDIQADDG